MKYSEEEKKLLDKYADLIQEYNKVMNLTGIDEYEQIYSKHYFDAYQVSKQIAKLNNINKIADLGSGMGVPGIVLAILLPEKQIYLIEPMQKRCKFLKIVVEQLKLNNVIIINERSEELSDSYDLVVARAVAKLNILSEISINLIKVNGYLLAMKAKNSEQELNDAKKALHILNYKIIEQDKYEHEDDMSIRNNILLQKTKKQQDKYPRQYKDIKKMPL